jgi:hypothetical protein
VYIIVPKKGDLDMVPQTQNGIFLQKAYKFIMLPVCLYVYNLLPLLGNGSVNTFPLSHFQIYECLRNE